jgi:ribonuclease G
MSKELVVSSSSHETRLAILENDQLVELYIERESQQGLAGSIHKGRVTRVLPGMQSAFVDVGLDRDAFLYVSDFFDPEQYEEGLESDGAAESEAKGADETPAAAQTQAADEAQANAEAQPKEAEADESRRGNRRGRRGRRGRRKTSRGGFPESKYAAIKEEGEAKAAPVKEPEPVEEEPTESAPVEASESDFAVLPGESLAKYSGAEAETALAEAEGPALENGDAVLAGAVEPPEPVETPDTADSEGAPEAENRRNRTRAGSPACKRRRGTCCKRRFRRGAEG